MGLIGYFQSRNIKTRMLHLKDELWDRKLGIKTFGHFDPTVKDGRYYGTAKYSVLKKVFDFLNPSPADLLIDLGCGLGRPMFYACSQYAIQKCIGIEANEALVIKAERNIENYKGKGKIEVQLGLAQNVNYDDATIIYMYNPFGYDTMCEVLAVLDQSLKNKPRRLVIIYLNPIEERVFIESNIFKKYHEMSHEEVPELNTGSFKPEEIPAISFFESVLA